MARTLAFFLAACSLLSCTSQAPTTTSSGPLKNRFEARRTPRLPMRQFKSNAMYLNRTLVIQAHEPVSLFDVTIMISPVVVGKYPFGARTGTWGLATIASSTDDVDENNNYPFFFSTINLDSAGVFEITSVKDSVVSGTFSMRFGVCEGMPKRGDGFSLDSGSFSVRYK